MAQILIIEDDTDFRQMLNIMLKQAGYDVIEASNGKEGLKMYDHNRVDLVITDVFMPEKEGLQTLFELKEQNHNVKVIAISGGGTRERYNYLDSMKDFGAQKVFTKPFVTEEFLAAIAKLLETE